MISDSTVATALQEMTFNDCNGVNLLYFEVALLEIRNFQIVNSTEKSGPGMVTIKMQTGESCVVVDSQDILWLFSTGNQRFTASNMIFENNTISSSEYSSLFHLYIANDKNNIQGYAEPISSEGNQLQE